MSRTVLVPLDGSELAERALPFAVSLAARARTTLRLIHVHASTGGSASVFPSMEAAENHVLSAVDRARGRVSVVWGDVMQGDVVRTLVHEAAARHTTWIVMTSGGAGGEGRWAGRIAAAMIEGQGAPILLCGPAANSVPVAFTGATRAGRTLVPNIAVALDGTADAESVVPLAARFARVYSARLTLICVSPDGSMPAAAAIAARDMAGYADTLVERLDEPDLQVSRRVVLSRDPATAFTRAAVEEDADAMAISRTFLGRDAGTRAIITTARLPFLI